MAYKISGRVIRKDNPLTLPSKSGNTYTKQDLVIAVRKFDPYTGEPTEDETNTPKFTFLGERINDLQEVNVGDFVTIHFEISGRSFTKEDGKTEYFNDIRPIRLERNRIQTFITKSNPTENLTFQKEESKVTEKPEKPKEEDGDLPF